MEISYQQHLTFLPGVLNGFGLSANYGYTKSDTSGVPLRTDKPALERQAPNTFNFSPTYDKGRFSARLGLSYNGAYVWSYVFQDLVADVNSPTGVSPNPVPLGKKGPLEIRTFISTRKLMSKPVTGCTGGCNSFSLV
jgi:hypothetical protein